MSLVPLRRAAARACIAFGKADAAGGIKTAGNGKVGGFSTGDNAIGHCAFLFY